MELREQTREVIARTEQITGCQVVVTPDTSLHVLSVVNMADTDRPAHVIRFRPSAAAQVDYHVVYQCGTILRLFENAPDARFRFAVSEHGQYHVLSLLKKSAVSKRLPMQQLYAVRDQLLNGLLVHLRSVPLGMRVDDWILRDYEVLGDMQRSTASRRSTRTSRTSLTAWGSRSPSTRSPPRDLTQCCRTATWLHT